MTQDISDRKLEPPHTVADLMRVCELGRDSVRAAIRSGSLPGYVVGRRYVIPRDAFDAFCAGTWVPQSRPAIRALPQPTDLLRKIDTKQRE